MSKLIPYVCPKWARKLKTIPKYKVQVRMSDIAYEWPTSVIVYKIKICFHWKIFVLCCQANHTLLFIVTFVLHFHITIMFSQFLMLCVNERAMWYTCTLYVILIKFLFFKHRGIRILLLSEKFILFLNLCLLLPVTKDIESFGSQHILYNRSLMLYVLWPKYCYVFIFPSPCALKIC